MTQTSSFWLALIALSALSGCVPATETFIELEADPELRGPAILTVQTQPNDAPIPIVERFETGPDFWPHELAFHPRSGDASRRFDFQATLEDAEGRVQVGARLGFARGQNRVQFRFERACRDVLCRLGTTCREGECVPSLPTPSECEDLVGACDPVTSCGCEPGLECRVGSDGEPQCARPEVTSPTPCTGSTGCPTGHACDLESGLCAARSDEACDVPASADGAAGVGERCTSHDACAAGFACAGRVEPMMSGDLEYSTAAGACFPSCNPCLSSAQCEASAECVGLPGGGGFCARGGLAEEGESCRETPGAERLCAAGLVCRSDRCVRLCRGEFLSVVGGLGHCTSLSEDCAPDEICQGPTTVGMGTAVLWGWCVARSPEFPSPEGGSCGVADGCLCPLRCTSQNDGPRFCERRNITSCAQCPEGTLCREALRGNPDPSTQFACIDPGSLRRYDPCDETAQCQEGLTCGTTGTCQPM